MPITSSLVYKAFDLDALGLLPSNWVSEIQRTVDSHRADTLTNGTSMTSREPSGSSPITVRVVPGDAVKEVLPWLHELYVGPMVSMAEEFAQTKLYSANDVRSGVNINLLTGHGARYERHVDSNPMTGLLFVSTLEPEQGGSLVFEADSGDQVVQPKSGIFLAFNATNIVHYVAPLQGNVQRISVPVNFYLSRDDQPRPSDLDEYLYSSVEPLEAATATD